MTARTQNQTDSLARVESHDLLAVAAWLVGGDIGASSKCMLAVALAGAVPESKWSPRHPLDSDDLGRCLRLVALAPSVRAAAFPLLAARSAKWAALIAEWDNLAALYERTPEKDSYRWRAVTSAMERLLDAVNAGGEGPPP